MENEGLEMTGGVELESNPLQRQLEERKNELIELLGAALRAAGLAHIDVRSIRFDLAARLPKCPYGTEPVWEARPRPDGSVEYVLVCK